MKPTGERPTPVTCTRCDLVVAVCAFCEREVCHETICYRCLRIQLGQSMGHPHVHGG
jgi:hypothetical protein